MTIAKRKRGVALRASPAHMPIETEVGTLRPLAPLHVPPQRDLARDSFAATAFADVLDRSTHAAFARFTAGISPVALTLAYLDWAIHLAASPGKQLQLAEKAVQKTTHLAHHAVSCAVSSQGRGTPCVAPLPHDKRFADPAWMQPPFNLIHQSFLLTQQWWHNATTGVRGVTHQHEQVLSFLTRQVLDMWSPANFLVTNPVALNRTISEGGMNLIRGAQYLRDDLERRASGRGPVGTEEFTPGRAVAITPGEVVFRNRLIELIQYRPTTGKVRPEPLLIVPAWIMKYYILDLSPHNSMVKYLTDQGFTVFMMSWKNPGPEDRDIGIEDYLQLGVLAALEVIEAIVPRAPVHAVGYCLGGTLLAMAAAYLARTAPDRLKSMTLLAAQTDFHEAGELTLFIDESQLALLDDIMWEQGFLDTTQMAGAFQMLRSNDLIWSRVVQHYLLGERPKMFDLLAWNADATRMPYRMHSQYLRQLFLKNDLAEGRMAINGIMLALESIRVPVFAVGTSRDHVSPWTSVFKIHHQIAGDLTFVLADGGHNAGIVPGPVADGRTFQVARRTPGQPTRDPPTWEASAQRLPGSWWHAWSHWLSFHSSASAPPPHMGTEAFPPLCPAPGTYVHQR